MADLDYAEILTALLPTGEAWPRDAGPLTRDQVIESMAQTFARVDRRLADLVREADPRSALELLGDWERVLGLPDSCAGQADTVAERRRRAHAKLIARGGQSPAYYIGLAAALGFTVTITEHRAATCESHCESPLDPDPWCHVWDVNAPLETIHELDCETGGCDEPLRSWGNQILECVIRRHKPAHTHVRFIYGA